jgi:hypothetical protein
MKIMAKHSSASVREHTPHDNHSTRTDTIMNALKRRAQAVLNDESLDAESRAIIRYGLETNDPWLAELVRRADAGESVIDTVQVLGNCDSQAPDTKQPDWADERIEEEVQQKIEELAAIICQAGGESAAALFVVMGTLENSTHPKALANTAKHFAFARCSQLNLYGIVDADMALVEGKLLTVSTPMGGNY